MAAFAALLHCSEGIRDLSRRFNALLGDHNQISYRIAVLINGPGEALGVRPDLGQGSIFLLRFSRLREMRPRRFDGVSQSPSMAGKGLTVERQTLTQHAAHRLTVAEKVLESRLTLAFRRVRIDFAAAADQGQAERGEQ